MDVSVLIQFLLKTSVFYVFFFISVIINLHKIIDRRCVLESSRQSDSNTRSQHMISWRNIEKKSLLIILIPTPILLYVRMKSWVTFVRRCFRDVNLQGILCLTGGGGGGGLTGLVVKSVGLHRETRVRSSAGSVCCFLEQETFTPQKYL